jgi:hypothetical protein
VPSDLLALAESFNAKRKAGTAQAHGSGYGGSGFKFNTQEDELRKALRKVPAAPPLIGILSCHQSITLNVQGKGHVCCWQDCILQCPGPGVIQTQAWC